MIKIGYWVSTMLLTAMMIMSAGMYFFNHEEIVKAFTALGYPTYLIYPLAVAKLLGLAAIHVRASKLLTHLAYAGFFFNALLAFLAHVMVGDGDWMGGAIALVLVTSSYFTGRFVFENE